MAESCVVTFGRDEKRKSSYPMIEVDEAIKIVLSTVSFGEIEDITLMNSLGRFVSQDIYATQPFPTSPVSIMDGYAVHAPISPGVYSVQGRIHAGDLPSVLFDKTSCMYITTGSVVPPGANAVIKIEDTESIPSTKSFDTSEKDEKQVKINVSASVGLNIRQIGSDINQGERVLKRLQRITPIEIGLLSTLGVTSIPVYSKPRIGVMSTGNELVNFDQEPLGGQIRDSNRPSLISAFKEEGYEVIDLGILRDEDCSLREALMEAGMRCDVIVTTGGVSMGEADLVKSTLLSLPRGQIHFGRLNMKPGKPATFGTFSSPSPSRTSSFSPDFATDATTFGGGGRKEGTGERSVCVFALPGNPVSCLVTKALLVDPALKRCQGRPVKECLHPVLSLRLAPPLTTPLTTPAPLSATSSGLPLDPERPEFHRASLLLEGPQMREMGLDTGEEGSGLWARSTSPSALGQRSSRLLSMVQANVLLCLPKGPDTVPYGGQVRALLIGQGGELRMGSGSGGEGERGLRAVFPLTMALEGVEGGKAFSGQQQTCPPDETLPPLNTHSLGIETHSSINTSPKQKEMKGDMKEEEESGYFSLRRKGDSESDREEEEEEGDDDDSDDESQDDGEARRNKRGTNSNSSTSYQSFASMLLPTPLPLLSSPSPSPSPSLSPSSSSSSSSSFPHSPPIQVQSINSEEWRRVRVGVMTISDRASQGVYPDQSGPALIQSLSQLWRDTSLSSSVPPPLTFEVLYTALVPDDLHAIQSALLHWTDPRSDTSSHPLCDLILTTGGTGFGPRDLTPEAVSPLLHRQAPGLAQALLNEGCKYTPLAVLSRPVVGTRYGTFIATLPGSVKAVKENIKALEVFLPRIMEVMKQEVTNDQQLK